jgi:valyl-tRNA synthetase
MQRVLMNCDGKDVGLDESLRLEFSEIDQWIVSRLQRTEAEVEQGYAEYRFDNAARALYEFVWDEYCDWYVEFAKVRLAAGAEAQQRATRQTLVRVLEASLRLAHPIIPFITEELWQKVAPLAGKSGPSIMLQSYPKSDPSCCDEHAEQRIALLKLITNACRTLRSEMGLGPQQKVPLLARGDRATLNAFALSDAARGYRSVIVDGELPSAQAPVSIVGDYQLMLKVEIDIAAEKYGSARPLLLKNDSEAGAKLPIELRRPRARCGRTGAPALRQFQATLENLRTQLAKLG